MKITKSFFPTLTLLTFLLSGCSSTLTFTTEVNKSNNKVNNDHLLGATNWFQTSGENYALQEMIYYFAKTRLKNLLDEANAKTPQSLSKAKAKLKSNTKFAVIMDIDETVLDNSAYQAQLIVDQESYNSKSWNEWVENKSATLIPGALDFIKFAQNQNVEVIYISNRKMTEVEATKVNFEKLNIPYKLENFIFKDKESGKENRRKMISEKYEILMLVGDNLNDFSDVFEGKDVPARMKVTKEHKDSFGKKWIVLPNPNYGDWEGSIFNYQFQKSEEEKKSDRMKHLKTWK